MIRVVEAASAAVPFPWIFGIGGIVALAVGLIFVIRPRQSGEVWWKLTQATRAYRVPKVPLGGSIAVGCFFLLIAATSLSFSWAFFQP